MINKRRLNDLVCVFALFVIMIVGGLIGIQSMILPVTIWSVVAPSSALVAVLLAVVLTVPPVIVHSFLWLAMVRLLSRIVPVGVDVQPKGTWIKLASYAALGVLAYGLFIGIPLVEKYYLGKVTDDHFMAFGAIPSALAYFGAVWLVATWHRRSRWIHGRPFVLYLRRFSTFSDRVVLGECFRACPPGVPLVLLVPRIAGVMDWNPFALSFAGLWRARRKPFSSLPLFIHSEDSDWEQLVQQLVGQADKIVLDVSDKSDAIKLETEMIAKASKWSSVVALAESQKCASGEVTPEIPVSEFSVKTGIEDIQIIDLIEDGTFRGRLAGNEWLVQATDLTTRAIGAASFVFYRRDWGRYWARVFIGRGLLELGASINCVHLIMYFVAWLLAFLGWSQALSASSFWGAGGIILTFGFLIYVVFFVHPGMNKVSSRILRDALH